MREIDVLNFRRASELSRGYLVTINLQHLYECLVNPSLRSVVFGNPMARICLDGRGARILFNRCFHMKFPLAVGNEVMRARLMSSAGRSILVIGSCEETIPIIRSAYPDIRILHDPSFVPLLDSESAKKWAANLVDKWGTDYSLVALALGVPKQEILAEALVSRLRNMPIMCVGGTFEMLAGRLPRAPRLIQLAGLEAIWRLILEPRRARLIRMIKSYWYFGMFYLMPGRLASLVGDGGK